MPSSDSGFDVDDFRRIQEETTRASARLSQMRQEIKQKLDASVSVRDAPSLSILASELSPSNHASPVAHFPIHTPFPSYDRDQVGGKHIMTESVDSSLSRVLRQFEDSINEKIILLKSENQKQRDLRDSISDLFCQKETELVNSVTSAISRAVESVAESPDELRDIIVSEGMEILKRKNELQQIQLRDAKLFIVSNKINEIESRISEEIREQLDSIRGELRVIQKAAETHSSNPIAHNVAHKLSEQIKVAFNQLTQHVESNMYSATPSPNHHVLDSSTSGQAEILDENAQLRKLVRKMKLALSKWRIDYLSNSSTVSTPAPITGISVGDEFSTLSDNLMRMWTAVAPSSQELIQFLVNVEAAVDSKGKIPLSSVYDYECKKNRDKLPIAQLAAQREFLMSRDGTVTNEIREIENELRDMIFQFEQKYEQKFVFRSDDDQDYLGVIDRVNGIGITGAIDN